MKRRNQLMKTNRFLCMILAIACGLCLTGCGQETAADAQGTELTAIDRDPATDDGVVWFDEEAIALTGSLVTDDMSDEERTRAEELHAIALEAMDLVNEQRQSNGLAALDWGEGLESCALVRAREIVTLFSHTRPNGRAWYTVDSNLMWGENLARGYSSAEDVVAAWMASPGHASNILNDDFESCAIAVYEVNNYLYFAQEFNR